jgi:phosphoserine phosphatase RsbU/P
MMSRVREVARRLGKSGIAFLIALALYLVCYFTGKGLLALLAFLALVPLTIILAVRGFRWVRENSLWSLRNRLLVVYGLIGVLPILLLFMLVVLGAWALTNELATYLASSALDRRLASINGAVEALRSMAPAQREAAVPEISKAFSHAFPGITFYFKDQTGSHRYPADAPAIDVPAGWKNVNGLIVLDGHFYGWAHYIDGVTEITALVRLSDEMVESLVPNLGIIALVETHRLGRDQGPPASVGSLTVNDKGPSNNPDYSFSVNRLSQSRRASRIPPPVGRLDVPVFIPTTVSHSHLTAPGQMYESLLVVSSRPSAVWRNLFSRAEVIRGVVFDALVGVAILFLVVELIAVLIGISLARRITRAVNQLHEGTRRVIHGDFRLRIPVRDHDQLGELSESFNQMTGNLERLLAVEKEKERLQTELEIAREVQSQLYPKEAPPALGLKLTVRCDPARMVSGDYYDYQEVTGGKLAFAIGDVAGKGISAALLMATLQAALRAQINQYPSARESEIPANRPIDAARLVSALNKQIYAHTSPEKYATFFFALFDETSRTLTYTNAGHLSPLLFRDGEVVSLDSNGTVVGAFPFSTYDESCLAINAGDLLVCYTDGITEPENAYGEMFGEERLIELIRKHAQRDDREIVEIILDSVRSWTGTPELHDDMTLLLAREVSTT